MEIHKFEPKNKYIEDLEDTSESDTTSISDNWDDDITYEDEESVGEEDMVQRSIVNRSDINEDFLLRIEDTGIRIIIQRINKKKKRFPCFFLGRGKCIEKNATFRIFLNKKSEK